MSDLEERYHNLCQKLCSPTSELNIEGLLDTLTSIYYDCASLHIRKEKNFENFVKQYASAVEEIEKCRINSRDFYEMKLIGSGAFGEVKLVCHEETKKIYAMKILSKFHMIKSSKSAFFWEERDIMAHANSEWLIAIHYAFQDDKFLYMVMDYMPGGDMINLISNYEFTESWTQFYIAELVLAIDALHKYGFIHRDIKPDNLLLDRNGHLKLADFGTCMKMNKDGLIYSDTAVGTPDYIAPEVISNAQQGKDIVYGRECDYWAVGIVLYEMIFIEPPFVEEHPEAIYGKIMSYKNVLQFPDDLEISSSCKKLIYDFLKTNKDQRLGRNGIDEIKKHPFFKNDSWEWDNIRNSVAPWVPELVSEDDTSNFDLDQFVEPKFNNQTLELSKGFAGNHLPFSGFTYSKHNRIIRENKRSGSSEKKDKKADEKIHELEAELQAEIQRKLESIELMKNLGIEETKQNDEIKALKKALQEQNTLKTQAVNKLAEIIQRRNAGGSSTELKRKKKESKRLQILLQQERDQCRNTDIKLRNQIYEFSNVLEKLKEVLIKAMMELDCKNMAMEQLQEENKDLKVALRTLRDLLPVENYNKSVIQQENLKLSSWLSIPEKRTNGQFLEKKINRKFEWKKQYVVLSKQKIFFFNNEQDKAANTPAIVIDIGKLLHVRPITQGDAIKAEVEDIPKIFQIFYDDEIKSSEEEIERDQAEQKSEFTISFKDHHFLVLTHNHVPNTCDFCPRQMRRMFKSLQAVECNRCHVKCHKDHLDRKEDCVQPCKVTVDLATAKHLLILANDVDEQKRWVGELCKKILHKNVSAC